MLESFSVQAVQIIENAKDIAKKINSEMVGSEHLLLALFKTPDSICHFLFSELNIKEEDLNNALEKMEIFHKANPNTVFTKKFIEIIEYAKQIAIETKSDYVYDEHLFYSLLELKDTVAYEIVNYLNIDIDEMLLDIEEIFNFFDEDEKIKTIPFPFLQLIQKDGFSHPYIKRKDYIEQIIYILKKKQKNNPLLIGNAGVGKSAIIEGLSIALKDELIYELDLGGVVAGTKYRGELEEKLIKALEYVKDKKTILFIDEIHNIVGAGSNDGSLDIANILKPYLTKPNIRIIGATTLDEYYSFIHKDKALTRRFQNIFIEEPTIFETLNILKKIKKHYEDYHHVIYTNNIIKEIVKKCDIYIPMRSFPDKAIDVLDEVGAIANYKKENISSGHINQVIYSINGIKPININLLRKVKLHFKELLPHYEKFINRKEKTRNIAVISVNLGFKIDKLLKDITHVFGVNNECFLEIDLDSYMDNTSLSNLIGSNKGYVGYEQGGILYEHILKYPISIIYFKNFKSAHYSIQNYLIKMINKNTVIDNKGRKISLSNTIFIFENYEHKKQNVGFENIKTNKQSLNFDVLLSDSKPKI